MKYTTITEIKSRVLDTSLKTMRVDLSYSDKEPKSHAKWERKFQSDILGESMSFFLFVSGEQV